MQFTETKLKYEYQVTIIKKCDDRLPSNKWFTETG